MNMQAQNAIANSGSDELHVVFGTGPVGLTLTQDLLARGKRVRLVSTLR